MITPIFRKDTTIDEISSLENVIKNSNCTKKAVADKKKMAMTKFVVGGAFICFLTVPVGGEAKIQLNHEVISQERTFEIIERAEHIFSEIKKDIELITEVNSFDLDSLIDGDEIRGEMGIISDYMEKAKDVYAFCNKEFTL